MLLTTWLVINGYAQFSSAELQTVRSWPYYLAPIVALLAVGFKQSRIFLATINLTLAYFLIQESLQVNLDRPDAYVLFCLLGLLIPINTMLISLLRERGLFTSGGVLKVALLLSGYLVLIWYSHTGQLGLLLPDLPSSMLQMVWPNSFLNYATLFTYLLSALLMFWVVVKRHDFAEAAMFITLLCSLQIFIQFEHPVASSLFTLAGLAILIVAVFQNSYKLAYIDELTNIPARRALQHTLVSLGRNYSVAMLDIDHFKKFNDTYGHDIGDQVLKMVAAQIQKVKGKGKAFRYGGEEFTVIFAGKTEEEALPFLEELRERIAQYPMQIRQQNRPKEEEKGRQQRKQQADDQQTVVHVTISIGLSERTDSHEKPEEVIKSADNALYDAKKGGRNCVCCAHFSATPKKTSKATRKDFAR